MKKLKLWFTDFYPGFELHNNFFLKIITEEFKVDLDENDPEFLIYSCYGTNFLNYNCTKIYYTGENLIPDFNLCDYAIGFSQLHFADRYLRFPNFALYERQFEKLIMVAPIPYEEIVKQKKHFCNFIYSNSKADPIRDHFFKLLSNYKKVLSPGKHLNNTALPIGERSSNNWMFSKLDFQSQCKFSIAFENSSSPGYTTEKIMHAFITNTIPIYWGNPEVTKDFNPKSFINCHDYKSLKEVVFKVKEIDKNEELYLSILKEPAFINNEFPEHLKLQRLKAFFSNIFGQEIGNARRRPAFGTINKYEMDFKKHFNDKKNFKKRRGLLNLFKQKLIVNK